MQFHLEDWGECGGMVAQISAVAIPPQHLVRVHPVILPILLPGHAGSPRHRPKDEENGTMNAFCTKKRGSCPAGGACCCCCIKMLRLCLLLSFILQVSMAGTSIRGPCFVSQLQLAGRMGKASSSSSSSRSTWPNFITLRSSLEEGGSSEGGKGNIVDSESERLRAEYLKARDQREETLLSEANRMDEDLATREDVKPEFITRWGGADLANEGPTRKTLELMSDSEWCVLPPKDAFLASRVYIYLDTTHPST